MKPFCEPLDASLMHRPNQAHLWGLIVFYSTMGRKISSEHLDKGTDYMDRLSVGLMRRKLPRSPAAHNKYIAVLKFSVLFGLITVAVLIGYFAYDVVRDSERRQFDQAYEALIDEIIPSTNVGISGTIDSVDELVTVLGDLFPNQADWPNVAYPGFTKMAITASKLTGAAAFVFTPLVLPEEVASFEAFAYDYYAQHPELYPPDVARSEFGRGIYQYGATNWSDHRFHDTTGDTRWNSPRKYLAPALQVTEPGQPQWFQNDGLMINTRFNDVLCGNAHDRVLDCAEERTARNATCAMLTGLNTLRQSDDPYPRAYILQPIFAANGDMNHVVGFAAAIIKFNNLLLEHIPQDSNHIEYVIRVNDDVLTYRIVDGQPVFKGLGDLHDERFSGHKRSVDVAEGLQGVESCQQMVYEMHFYPTREYVQRFQTELRWVFCFGSVGIIVLVSLLFALYDWAMVRENSEQQAVLETKRQFVRFISHEVRTPLNAVSMAGELLLEQLTEATETMLRVHDAAQSLSTPMSTGLHNSGKHHPGSLEHAIEDSLDLCAEIVANTRDAVEVLNDLLNYDKIEVGGLALDLTYVAIEAMVDTVVKPFKGAARKKDVVIVTDFTRFHAFPQHTTASQAADRVTALRVVGDKVRLEQVLRNLLSNALKFTSPLGKVTVTLRWVESGLEHHLMPPQLRKHLVWPAAEQAAAKMATRVHPHDNMSFLSSASGATERVMPSGAAVSDLYAPAAAVGSVLVDEPSAVLHTAMTEDDGNVLPSKTASTVVVSRASTVRPAAAMRALCDEPTHCARCGSLVLEVADDGAGLTAEQLQQIFLEGVQFNVSELQAGQGGGLGLYIAKGIIKQHGGQLTVGSEGRGKGSTFVVELPAFLCEYEYQAVLSTESAEDKDEIGEAADVLGLAQSDQARELQRQESFAPRANSDRSLGSSGRVGSGRLAGLSGPASLGIAPVNSGTGSAFLEMSCPTDNSRSRARTLSIAVSEDGRPVPARKVLIVDDVASNLKMTARLLQRNGVETCDQATDGSLAVEMYTAARQRMQQQAHQSAQQTALEDGGGGDGTAEETTSETVEPYDAILMDFEMPVMNGPTATAQLRALGCKVPIIGVTGNVLPADVQYFLDCGANAVLPKPLRFAELNGLWRKKGPN